MGLLQVENEPRNVKEALWSPLKENHINAMEDEMETIKVNKVLWELINLLERHKAIGYLATSRFSNSNARLIV